MRLFACSFKILRNTNLTIREFFLRLYIICIISNYSAQHCTQQLDLQLAIGLVQRSQTAITSMMTN